MKASEGEDLGRKLLWVMQEPQSHPSRYQPPGTLGWVTSLERLVKIQGWHKEENPMGHSSPTMPGWNRSCPTTNKITNNKKER